MGTIKILLGIICFIAFSGSRGVERDRLSGYADDGAYQRVVAAAKKETGVREGDVPNTGPEVSRYLRYVGIKTPAPWCAAWVSYVFGQAGFNAPKTAWSPDLFPAQRSVKAARPGFVLGIYYPALKRIGHCGIVIGVKGDLVYSVEGNTNVNGGREGDGVYRKVRHRRSIHSYADWSQILVISSQTGTQLRNAPRSVQRHQNLWLQRSGNKAAQCSGDIEFETP